MVDQKYCRNCGTPNLPDAKFCANCGATIVSAAASPSGTAPPAAPTPLRQQPPYSPPPKPRTIFGLSRKMIVVGLVVVVLLLTLGCVALMANTPSTTTTTNPTATPMATTLPQATASQTTPTVRPTSSGSTKLTSDQLSVFENVLVSDGYTVTQHLTYNQTNADGSTMYSGQLTKDGITYDYNLNVYKDQASADAGFSSSVSTLQALGFTQSSSSSTEWIGTQVINGQAVGGLAEEMASSAPYIVMVAFGS